MDEEEAEEETIEISDIAMRQLYSAILKYVHYLTFLPLSYCMHLYITHNANKLKEIRNTSLN